MTDAVRVRAAQPGDQQAWLGLWTDYCAFYKAEVPARVTATLWARVLDPAFPVNGLVAEGADGTLLGLCHYVLHPHTWSADPVCYLEDLFTTQTARGRGVGRSLIRHLEELGRTAGWNRVFWHTEGTNATARMLYDKVTGGADGFVRYTIPLNKRD